MFILASCTFETVEKNKWQRARESDSRNTSTGVIMVLHSKHAKIEQFVRPIYHYAFLHYNESILAIIRGQYYAISQMKSFENRLG